MITNESSPSRRCVLWHVFHFYFHRVVAMIINECDDDDHHDDGDDDGGGDDDDGKQLSLQYTISFIQLPRA